MHTTKVNLQCPNCKTSIDSIDHIKGGRNAPGVGDPSVCGICGVVAVFTHTMQLRVATQADINRMSKAKQKAIAEFSAQFGQFIRGVASCRVQ